MLITGLYFLDTKAYLKNPLLDLPQKRPSDQTHSAALSPPPFISCARHSDHCNLNVINMTHVAVAAKKCNFKRLCYFSIGQVNI